MNQPHVLRAARTAALGVAALITAAAIAGHAVAAGAGVEREERGAVRKAWAPPQGITSFAVSRDGRRIVAADSDSQLHVWNGAGRKLYAIEGHPGTSVSSIVLSPTRKEIFSSGRDSVVRRWRRDDGAMLQELSGLEHPVRALALSNSGGVLAAGGEDLRVGIWNSRNGKLLQFFTGHKDFVNALAFRPGTSRFELASGGMDGVIIRWRKNGKMKDALLGHAGPVNALRYADNGAFLASGSDDGTVKIWRAKSGHQKHSLEHPFAVHTVALSSNGRRLASAGKDSRVYIWNPRNGRLLKVIDNGGKAVNALAFLPGKNILWVGDDTGTVRVWDVSKRALKRRMEPLASADAPAPATQRGPFDVVLGVAGRVLDLLVPAASAQTDPGQGPGGPIVVLTSQDATFGTFYAEILRAEGLNAFAVDSVDTISAAELADYDVAILAPSFLLSGQVTMLTDWVNAGGNLIAMRPDPQLAPLLGLVPTGTTLAEGYLQVDRTTPAGAGIVGETMQFHGTADQYTLDSATSIATLYSNATAATASPAVTTRSVGSAGGSAAAFTFDLATSVVYTRQGNPAWANQERDGLPPQRSDDKFFGNAIGDPQADWIDFNKIAIPQADEQQRLLANMITLANLDRAPLPRFWYFPRGEKAVVVMTGDDHGNNGTAPRWNQYLAASPQGCSVADWECVRATSYIYTNTPMSDAEAAAFEAQGFEVGLHLTTGCADFTESQLQTFYSQQMVDFATTWPSVPAPTTQRHHCIAWTGWATGAKVQSDFGIGLDTSYYYWPPSWVLNRPGFFTGSGMPMRFADLDGSLIDNYLAATQMTDHSGQAYPFTVDALLDRALGPEQFYGAFVAIAHTDIAASEDSDAIVASSQARGVPVVSSRQLLEWLQGRNDSSFDTIAWDGVNLSFDVTVASGANGLQAHIPRFAGTDVVESVTLDGAPVTFGTVFNKGLDYVVIPAQAGSYVVSYAPDIEAPTVAATYPANGSVEVGLGEAITATFSESMDAASIDGLSFDLRDGSGSAVSATISYDASSRTATLTPDEPLAGSTSYTARVYAGGASDLSGNAVASTVSWTFDTFVPLDCPCTLFEPSTTPGTASSADPNALELGVRFRSSVSGYVTGVRFYKGSLNTGSHVGNLWTADGALLASATFTNETASGWQQVDFATPVAISADTVYVASYHAPNGGYASDSGYFNGAPVDNRPLSAGSDGGNNGVYRYGPSAFPSQSFNATNYWVDVVFEETAGGPTVVATSPADGETGVATLSTTVTATFDQAMDESTIVPSNFEVTGPGGSAVPGAVSFDAATRTASLAITSLLAGDAVYTAVIRGGPDGVADVAGTPMSGDAGWSFTTEDAGSAGDCASLCLWTSPITPAVLQSSDSSPIEVGVRFRSDVPGEVTGVRFFKGPLNGGTHVGSLWSETGTLLAQATFANESGSGWQRVDFSSPVTIEANTTYVVSYHTSVGRYSLNEDYFDSEYSNGPLRALANSAGGNGVYAYGAGSFPTQSFAASNYWVDVEFTAVADTTAPTVVATTPADGATGVALDISAAATFSEGIDVSTLNSGTLELRDASNSLVVTSASYDAGTRTVTMTPSAALSPDAVYTATIIGGASGVTDIAGNPLGANVSWSFTTEPPGADACPSNCLWDGSVSPAIAQNSDSNAVELGVKFSSSTAGEVTAIRFYKGPLNTGIHVGSLWTANGSLLAQATFSNETSEGWQRVEFANPVPIAANVTYVASYHAPVGRYAIDVGYFNSGRSNGPLTAPATGASGGNGVFAYGSGGFPANSYQGSNYWVDVEFSVVPDTTPPTVTGTVPADTATGVALDTTLSATFSEALDAATVDGTSVELRDDEGALVAATVGYDAGTFTATLTPASPLDSGVTYTATLVGGASGITDLLGNALGGNVSWSFETVPPLCATSCLWDGDVTPLVLQENDASAIELGVRFRSDVAGSVTGVRFYKGPLNNGVHTGSLWNSAGVLLAQATFSNETAEGWQSVEFDQPVQIEPNTIYVASYHTTSGYYSVDSGFFASQYSNGPLRAVATSPVSGNGVFQYGPGGFPSNAYQSSNYWVDVEFSIGLDETPPTVLQTWPIPNGTLTAQGTSLTATFSEVVDPATINTGTFELRDASNALVATTLDYDGSTRIATLTPAADLTIGESYTATIRGGASGVLDLAGNPLDPDYTWSFDAVNDPCVNPPNAIVAENCLPGSPPAEWQVGTGDPSIEGFATDISVVPGDTVTFKVDTVATDYRLDIYRVGYYDGLGARLVATVDPSVTLPQLQPECLSDEDTGLVDCGNWAPSASWDVPLSAVSGVYLAKLEREDGTAGASHIIFIVRDDEGGSDILFQTADTTWQAYNRYGGNSLYFGDPAGRAYAVSYNRPFVFRGCCLEDWFFNAEYPMVRWLESNGYDVSYFTGVDSDRYGAEILEHKAFLSVGHDEYWSADQRENVEAARDAGVHLAFLSGNEVFWKTRWEPSIDGSGTPHRTLVSYKETLDAAKIDPEPNVWTGTWRDPSFSPPADGGQPENALTGTIFTVNGYREDAIEIPELYSQHRFWRNTAVAQLAPGGVAVMPPGTLGYEWDEDLDNGFRPDGLMRLSRTTVQDVPLAQGYGGSFAPGEATHSLTLYRAASGALVFGAGTVQWSWGLDSEHDFGVGLTDESMKQATVNLFADMGMQPQTLQPGLIATVASTDTTPASAALAQPAQGASLPVGQSVTISGTASDAGGGVVGAVEVSTDGGVSWHPADGLANWSYSWTPSVAGSANIRVRATDDSGNLEVAGAGITVTITP